MQAVARSRIAVSPASTLTTRRRLLGALEAAFPVRFCAAQERADAVLVLTTGRPGPLPLGAGRPPSLATPSSAPAGGPGAEAVELLDHEAVDRRLRGVRLDVRAMAGPLTVEPGEAVLAATASGAAWTAAGDAHRVSAALPELAPDQVLRDLLVTPHALSLVALVHLLRHVQPHPRWTPPAVRATMLFDDPNLRRRRYGFIDFEALVAHADAHGYHAAMAMVPLDAAAPHRETAELFRRRRDRLSLVVHGNNHLRHELSGPACAGRELATAAQALRRVARFEALYGVRVDRVMTPPHGMCAPEMARALGRVGFDALCALHPLPWREGSPADRLLAGWEPAEWAGPCAVISRMPLHASVADIALHAFLDHPIVLYGHHDDLADGLEPLSAAAGRVDAVGGVVWTPMEEIVLGNHAVLLEDGVAHVRPFAGRVRVELPAAAQALAVPAPREAAGEHLGWSAAGGPILPFGEAVPTDAAGRQLELRLRPVGERAPGAVAPPPPSPWPVLRRRATELRDRARPLAVLPRPAVAWRRRHH